MQRLLCDTDYRLACHHAPVVRNRYEFAAIRLALGRRRCELDAETGRCHDELGGAVSTGSTEQGAQEVDEPRVWRLVARLFAPQLPDELFRHIVLEANQPAIYGSCRLE